MRQVKNKGTKKAESTRSQISIQEPRHFWATQMDQSYLETKGKRELFHVSEDS